MFMMYGSWICNYECNEYNYHLLSCEFESHSWQGVLNTIQHYVIKFFRDLRHGGGAMFYLQMINFFYTEKVFILNCGIRIFKFLHLSGQLITYQIWRQKF